MLVPLALFMVIDILQEYPIVAIDLWRIAAISGM